MVRLTINGKVIEAADGASLLEAAEDAGAIVPTLCHLKKIGALTSCMLCVVKDVGGDRLLPSCTARVQEGLVIETDTPEVHEARRSVLRMLLDEHAGDCEGPCARICPAGLNIPRMLRHQAAGEDAAAARLTRRDLIFPAVLGRLCTAPCEKVCRRGPYDTPVAIRRMHRTAAEAFLPVPGDWELAGADTGKSVAILGAGLAGLTAAAALRRLGHACHVYEKETQACPTLRQLPEGQLPAAVLDAEINAILRLGITLETGVNTDEPGFLEALIESFDAVLTVCAQKAHKERTVFTVTEEAMHVRAVGNGKAAAHEIDAFLRGLPEPGREKAFNATLNKVRPEEMATFAVERKTAPSESAPSVGVREGPCASVPEEAARCLHCDCLKLATCKLRGYAQEYGLAPQVKRIMERPALLPIQRAGNIQLEPGKCVKCGLCVAITRAAGVVPGMTLTGRGLASTVQPAFGAPLAGGLGAVAEECVRACPTAALAFRDKEESS